MEDIDHKLVFLLAVIDKNLVGVADGRRVIRDEIEAFRRNIFDQKFLAIAEFPGHFFGQFEVTADFNSRIKTFVFSFLFNCLFFLF